MFFFRKKYPVVLPAHRHPMTRGRVDREVLAIMERLRGSGYSAYLVGGCVRDILLGKKVKDFDIVTDARPRQISRLFKRCFLVGKRFRLAHVYVSRDRFVEVATFRAVVDPEEERVKKFGENNVFGTIEEDALRRDFTINALYYDGVDSSIVDYTGGLRDLKKKILCSIGDPDRRFREDPVRMIRAGRFCAQLDFRLSKKDFQAARACASHITTANSHRLLEELYKILRCGASARTFINLKEYGLLQIWLPELAGDRHWNSLIARLRVVDRLRNAGQELPASLLLSVLLFDHLKESVPAGTESGGFHAVLTAIRSGRHGLSERIFIPKREWESISTMTARVWTFSNPPDPKRKKRGWGRFLQSESFAESLRFFEIIAESTGNYEKELAFWRKAQADISRPHREEQKPRQEGEKPEGAKRKRRRPRRKKKKAPAAETVS